MSHGVEHRRRRRECVIRELLIADSDRRLRLSSSIQEYSQSKESYYIPTYIQILLSSTNLRSCLEKKGGKRLIHTYMGTQFQAGPYLDLQHICLLNTDFLVAALLHIALFNKLWAIKSMYIFMYTNICTSFTLKRAILLKNRSKHYLWIES